MTLVRPQKGITPEQPHQGGDEPPPGVQVTAARRGTLIRLWRGVVRVTLVLLLLVGATNAIVKPVLNAIAPPAPPPAAGIDTDTARATAVTAATEWLTYNPQQAAAYHTNLGRQFTGGQGDAVNAWTGSAWMAPDIVTAGAVTDQPGPNVTVTVHARVRIATPTHSDNPPGNPPNQAGTPANDPTLPAGWTVVDTQWMRLTVPVVITTTGAAAASTGPVFATTNPAVTTTPGPSSDSDDTQSSKQWATSLFTALAGTDPTALGYLTTGDPIPPMNGQVTLAGVNSWQVQTRAEGQTGQAAVAAVTWKLASADLQVKQAYAVELTDRGGRWFATTITPGGTA